MTVLVTGGGCCEMIDGVRSVCNYSTGRTASFIAEYFCCKGHDVMSLVGYRAITPDVCGLKNCGKLTVKKYKSFADLSVLLKTECSSGKYNLVIHAAAVSDYSPDVIEVDGKEYRAGSLQKIPSGKTFAIRMTQNPKLLESIKVWSGKKCFVTAFKLTNGASYDERQKAVNTLFNPIQKMNAPDIVVSNDLTEIHDDIHPCMVYSNHGLLQECSTLTELAQTIESAAIHAVNGGNYGNDN